MNSYTHDAPLAPIKEGRPVNKFTDNSVETIVFLKHRCIMTLSMPFKSKLSPHCHRGGKGYEYTCPLTLRMETCQSTHQDNFVCNFVILKGELIKKLLPLAMIWARV